MSEEKLRALIVLAAEDICDNKTGMLYTDCTNAQVFDIAATISTRVQMHLDGRWVFDEERIMNYLRVVRRNAIMRDLIAAAVMIDERKVKNEDDTSK